MSVINEIGQGDFVPARVGTPALQFWNDTRVIAMNISNKISQGNIDSARVGTPALQCSDVQASAQSARYFVYQYTRLFPHRLHSEPAGIVGKCRCPPGISSIHPGGWQSWSSCWPVCANARPHPLVRRIQPCIARPFILGQGTQSGRGAPPQNPGFKPTVLAGEVFRPRPAVRGELCAEVGLCA